MNIEYLMKKYKLSRVEALEVNRILEEQSELEFEQPIKLEKDDKVLIFQPPKEFDKDFDIGGKDETWKNTIGGSIGSFKSFDNRSSGSYQGVYQSQFRTLSRMMPWPFLIIEKSIK